MKLSRYDAMLLAFVTVCAGLVAAVAYTTCYVPPRVYVEAGLIGPDVAEQAERVAWESRQDLPR